MESLRFIIFICTSCEYRNRMELGMPGFNPLQTEFPSLTQAMEHINEQEYPHEIIAKIQES